MIGILIFLGFLILILSGIPIAFAMILMGILFILFLGGESATLLLPFNRLAAGFSFPLLAVYFYILLGRVMNETKISDYLVGFFIKLAGKIFKVGVSGMIMTLSCAATGALTGSAVGTTAAVGGILIVIGILVFIVFLYGANLLTGILGTPEGILNFQGTVVQGVISLVGAVVGAGIALGIFLLAIMKA